MSGHKPFKELSDSMSQARKDRVSAMKENVREEIDAIAAHSAAFGAAYQIIAAFAGECGRLGDPAVVAALDYFLAAAEGDVQDVGKVLPFHTEKDPPVS